MPEIKSKNNRSRINTRILLRDNSGRNIPFFHFSEFPVSPAHRSCIGPLPFHQKHHPGHKIQDTPFPAFAFPLPRAQVFIDGNSGIASGDDSWAKNLLPSDKRLKPAVPSMHNRDSVSASTNRFLPCERKNAHPDLRPADSFPGGYTRQLHYTRTLRAPHHIGPGPLRSRSKSVPCKTENPGNR